MSWREVGAEEWAALVMGRKDGSPTTRLMQERTRNAEEVRRLQGIDGRRLYVSPADGPPQLVFAISPNTGPDEFHAAGVRGVGDYAYLPLDLLAGVNAFKVLTCADSVETMRHLNPARLTTQYMLALTPETVPAYPQRVENLGTAVGPVLRNLWSEFWYDHEQRRASLGYRTAPEPLDEEMERLIAQDLGVEAFHFITTVDGAPAGAARCRSHPNMPSVISIEGNYVHPDYRRMGIGRDQLLARLHCGFHDLGCTTAISSVVPGNEASEQNLIARGFQEESTVYLVRR